MNLNLISKIKKGRIKYSRDAYCCRNTIFTLKHQNNKNVYKFKFVRRFSKLEFTFSLLTILET